MNNIENKIADIDRLLDAEIKALNRLKRNTTFVGWIILVMIFGYIYYLTSVFNRNLNTKALSNILVYELTQKAAVNSAAEQAIINSLKSFIGGIRNQSPELMNEISDSLNLYFRNSITEIFRKADRMLESEILRQGSPYRGAIAIQLEKMSDPARAEAELAGIDAVIDHAIFSEVRNYLDFCLVNLKKIENQINDVLNRKNLNEKEQLIKQFIIYWINFFELNFKMSAKIRLEK